jgi:transcriptional regulator with XRE-family HTH domain
LKLARQTRGLTLKALSEAANCSESLLSKLENGKASPSLPHAASPRPGAENQYWLDVRRIRW